jgi:hypothetical protein
MLLSLPEEVRNAAFEKGEEMGSESLAVSRHRRHDHAVTRRDGREIGNIPPWTSIRGARERKKE